MRHGGDPVLQGTRYIIAAFLLLDAYDIDDDCCYQDGEIELNDMSRVNDTYDHSSRSQGSEKSKDVHVHSSNDDENDNDDDDDCGNNKNLNKTKEFLKSLLHSTLHMPFFFDNISAADDDKTAAATSVTTASHSTVNDVNSNTVVASDKMQSMNGFSFGFGF